MVDRAPGEALLRAAWRSLSHRLSVAAGSFVALLSLFHHVPIPTASMRGAATYFAVLLASRLGLFALQRAVELDRTKGGLRDAEEGNSRQ